MDCKPENVPHTSGVSQNSRNTVFKLISSLLSILILFIVLEAGTRIWLSFFAGEETFQKYASLRQLNKRYTHIGQRWTLHRYLGHIPTPNYHRGLSKHNSLGYRSDEIVLPKPEGTLRIVCMGGSTTYSTGVKDNKMAYPALLEKELKDRDYSNVEVINSGVGAWTSWESLINFEFRILDLEPDIIIVYHAVNDITARMVWPPEAYKGDNSGRIAPPSMDMPSLLEYSSLLRYLMIRMGLIKSHSSIDRHIANYPDSFVGNEFREQKIKKTYPEGIFKEVDMQKILKANKPVYFRRNLEHIILIANYRKVKTVLATFAYSPQFTDVPMVSSEEIIGAFAEMNQEIKDIASDTGANLFDFAGVFPVDKGYYTDGLHVNEKGSQLKAKLFADYLVENGLLKK